MPLWGDKTLCCSTDYLLVNMHVTVEWRGTIGMMLKKDLIGMIGTTEIKVELNVIR